MGNVSTRSSRDTRASGWRWTGSLVAVTVSLAACGSSGPQSSVSVNTGVTAASVIAVTTAPGTTSAATTPAPITVIVTVQVTAAETTPESDAPTDPPAATEAPPAQTKPKTTTPRTTTTAAPTTVPALYAEVSPPTPPSDHTSDVPDTGSLPNGVYWVDYTGGETDTPAMRVQQAFFGPACVTKAAQTQQTCDNGLFIPSSPDRETALPFASNVKLTVSDERTKKSYRITPDELTRIRASSPSDGAPSGYGFTNFRFLMTFSNGKITKFEQLWTAN